jgi:hypothetical protein
MGLEELQDLLQVVVPFRLPGFRRSVREQPAAAIP